MLGKGNIEKQIEMNYRADVEVLPTELAIGATVDYEDRPSIEELQRRQSYESQRSSARSSSASSDDV